MPAEAWQAQSPPKLGHRGVDVFGHFMVGVIGGTTLFWWAGAAILGMVAPPVIPLLCAGGSIGILLASEAEDQTYLPNPAAMQQRLIRCAWRLYLGFEDDWATHHEKPHLLPPTHLRNPLPLLFEYSMPDEVLAPVIALDQQLTAFSPDLVDGIIVPLVALKMKYGLDEKLAENAFAKFEHEITRDRHWFQPELMQPTREWFKSYFIDP